MTILVVDDDIDDLLFFTDALAEIDPSIRSVMAFNGIEALQKLETIQPPPDYIFLDLNMPKVNGKQCLVFSFTKTLIERYVSFAKNSFNIKSTSNLKSFPYCCYAKSQTHPFYLEIVEFKLIAINLKNIFKCL